MVMFGLIQEWLNRIPYILRCRQYKLYQGAAAGHPAPLPQPLRLREGGQHPPASKVKTILLIVLKNYGKNNESRKFQKL